jgi:hypothetical protein
VTITYPSGKPVKLLVDLQGFPDGRVVLFEIWVKKKQDEKKIIDLYGVVKGGKAMAHWIPDLESSKDTLVGGDQAKHQADAEKYYFKVKIDDQEDTSEDIVFAAPLCPSS